MFYENIFKSKLNILLISIILIGFSFGLVYETYGQSCPTIGGCPEFNVCPGDKETLRLKNRTQGDAEWKDPISANPGDRVAFDVYYHNCVAGTVANNTKIRLDFPSALKSQIVTTAYLWADNVSYVSDTGTINASSPQKLVFDSTAKWYPNQGTAATIVPVTQISCCSVQVDIGDIKGNWSYQGHVVFEATLTPVSVAPIVDIKANNSNGPITISYKDNVILSWTSENAVSCQASGDWSGSKAVSGSQTIQMNIVKTYTFALTCQDVTSTKTATDSVTIIVTPNPPVVITKPAVITY